jgi:large subunit ribosomal protein L10
MPNKKNLEMTEVLKEKVSKAKSIVIADYSGIEVSKQTELRQKIRDNGGEFLVSKNTLMNIATGKREELQDAFNGMNGLILSYEDEIAPIREAYKFFELEEKFVLKAGLMGNEILDETKIKALSKMPSKDELMATMIARIKGPIVGFMNVLNGNGENLVRVLKAISEKE